LSVFKNRALRKECGLKRGEVTGVGIKLIIQELRDLHSSPDVIRVIKSRRMKQVRHLIRVR
jgi:hypothetical protein